MAPTGKVKNAEQIFDAAIAEAQDANVFRRKTAYAVKWYQSIVKDMAPSVMSQSAFTDKTRYKQRIRPGQLFAYVYDAKTKDTLPYWDRFPLVFPISYTEEKTGWYGLNMHYIPVDKRARLMGVLYRTMNNTRYDESTKLKLSYEFLLNLGSMDAALGKVAFKQYLSSHVKSRFIYIKPDEWPVALFLPLARWQKESAASVEADVRRKIQSLRKR